MCPAAMQTTVVWDPYYGNMDLRGPLVAMLYSDGHCGAVEDDRRGGLCKKGTEATVEQGIIG